MFIRYNDTNVHALPHVTYRDVRMKNKKTGKVRVEKRVDTNQSPQDIQWLRPGWNEFPRQVWEANKDHPQIQAMLRKGKIVLMDEKVTLMKGGKKITKQVGPADEPVRLKWFAEKRAVEIVKETYHRDILQRWLDEETRSRVKRALEAQIEPLRVSEEDKDGNAAEDDDDEAAYE